METPRGRTYGDACAAAHALDLVGERWALLVVRELLFGPKRFSDLQDALPKARPSVLTQRLRELTAADIVRRRKLGPPARAWIYELTEWGHSLEPVLLHLGRWGSQSPHLGQGVGDEATFSADSMMLALESHFVSAKAGDLDDQYLITLGDDRFGVTISDGEMIITQEEPRDPVLAIHTDVPTLRALIILGHSPRQARQEGHLQLEGDESALDRLLHSVRSD